METPRRAGRSAQRKPQPRGVSTRAGLLRAAAALAAGLAAAALDACGPLQRRRQAAESGAPVEVSFMRPAAGFLVEAYEAQAERFNQKQRRVRARFDTGASADYGGWLAKLTTMVATDTAPDCFLVQQFDLPSLATAGSLVDLSPRLARDGKEVNATDFFPSHLEGGQWRGRQVAITPDGCAILEYYNLNLFQEVGVSPPQPTWTWSDYLDAARRLTKRDGAGQVVQAGIGTVPSGNQLWPWLWSNGGDVFRADFRQVRVTEQAVVDAVQFIVDLVQRHGVTSGSPGVSLGPSPNENGKVAMWRGNRGGFGGLRSVTSFKFSVVPIARAPGRSFSTTVTTPGHIAIAKSNKQQEAAWEWMKFLTGTEALIIRSEIAGGCPSRRSATQHPSYKDFTMPALASTEANNTFADVLMDGKTARFVPKYVAINDAQGILSTHVAAARQGQQSVPAALEATRQELEALLREKPQPQA